PAPSSTPCNNSGSKILIPTSGLPSSLSAKSLIPQHLTKQPVRYIFSLATFPYAMSIDYLSWVLGSAEDAERNFGGKRWNILRQKSGLILQTRLWLSTRKR